MLQSALAVVLQALQASGLVGVGLPAQKPGQAAFATILHALAQVVVQACCWDWVCANTGCLMDDRTSPRQTAIAATLRAEAPVGDIECGQGVAIARGR